MLSSLLTVTEVSMTVLLSYHLFIYISAFTHYPSSFSIVAQTLTVPSPTPVHSYAPVQLSLLPILQPSIQEKEASHLHIDAWVWVRRCRSNRSRISCRCSTLPGLRLESPVLVFLVHTLRYLGEALQIRLTASYRHAYSYEFSNGSD